jgi:hypothetical protein
MEEIIKYEYEPHSPTQMRNMPWLYCRHCGLLYLKNDFTRWCIKMGCDHKYHPGYKSAMRGKL